MNTASRICVVFVVAASLSFMAFAGAMRSGGNWLAEAEDLGPDFVLNLVPGDKGMEYSMTYRPTGAELKRSTYPAEVVVAAQEKRANEAQQDLQKLKTRAEVLDPQIKDALQAIAADEQGLIQRVDALKLQFDEVREEIDQVNRDIVEKANAAQQIRSEGQERREEVYRLRNQLELLKNDLFAAQVQHKNLTEEEIRLQELLRRLERRRQQLNSRTGKSS